jgi:hypothetical protein
VLLWIAGAVILGLATAVFPPSVRVFPEISASASVFKSTLLLTGLTLLTDSGGWPVSSYTIQTG